jgi:FkbM family methyltransferase
MVEETEKIIVRKRGVLYTLPMECVFGSGFANVNYFLSWENHTFDAFDYVYEITKDINNSVAIDIGSHIGITSVWLSKHFKSVLSIDGDKLSCFFFKKVMEASKCGNFTLIEKPVSHEKKTVIFGPNPGWIPELNSQTSQIKDSQTAYCDYQIETVPYFYVLNVARTLGTISFVKCDIEAGEEDIIDDLLGDALESDYCVNLSFHIEWWKNKDLSRFATLFSKFTVKDYEFKTGLVKDPIEFLKQHPMGTLLFEPC